MICWVLYDIVSDKARTKAAKYCKQAGLYRVQYSVFLGTLEPSRRDALELQLDDDLLAEIQAVHRRTPNPAP